MASETTFQHSNMYLVPNGTVSNRWIYTNNMYRAIIIKVVSLSQLDISATPSINGLCTQVLNVAVLTVYEFICVARINICYCLRSVISYDTNLVVCIACLDGLHTLLDGLHTLQDG